MARYDLGLSSAEFYSLQPRQLDALISRYERDKHGTEFLFAQLGCLVANFSQARPKEPIEPRDLMPSEWAKPKHRTQSRLRPRSFIATEIRGVMEGFRRTNNGDGG